jgi:hypothetical protein
MQWLPEAVRADRGQRLHWANTRHPKGVIHTTEGRTWPDYDGWTVNPHATVMPVPGRGVDVRQHVPFDYAAFALVHRGGGETNRDYAIQFELIGTCDRQASGYYWPDADDVVLRDLFVKVIAPMRSIGLRPVSTVQWKAYPASYGAANGVRLNYADWDRYVGWLGHAHVPENLHGDPGAFPWARMMTLAAAPQPDEEDEVVVVRATSTSVSGKVDDGSVYLVSGGGHTHVPDPATLHALGLKPVPLTGDQVEHLFAGESRA